MCRESSAFCMQEVVSFSVTWLISVENLWPALVYTWIWYLLCILLLTETMTVPSHPHVFISTIGAKLEKNVRVEPHCSHMYKVIVRQPHCTTQLIYNSHYLTITYHLSSQWLPSCANPRPPYESPWNWCQMPISPRKMTSLHGVDSSSMLQ
jgi:hypothetical protein